MTVGERMAIEEIYGLFLHRDGKAERRTRAICKAILGDARAAYVASAWDAQHNYTPRKERRQ